MSEDKRTPFDIAMDDILDRSDKAGLDTGKILGEALVRFFNKIEPKNRIPNRTGQTLSIKKGKLVESNDDR